MYQSGSDQMAKEIWRKISRIMKTSAKLRNCRASSKNATKLMWTISKYFLNITDIRQFLPIFKKYFQNVPINNFAFFWFFELARKFFIFAEVFIIIEKNLYKRIKSTHISIIRYYNLSYLYIMSSSEFAVQLSLAERSW